MENKGIKYEFYAVELNSYYGAIITIIAPTKREVEKRAKELGREDYIWEIRKHSIDTPLRQMIMLR
jgi:hypothetical protein